MRQSFVSILRLLLLFSLGLTMTSSAQTDSTKTTKRSTFLALPSLAYTQETNLAFGASSVYSFYTAAATTATRQSALYTTGVYTLNKQALFSTFMSCWMPNNRTHLIIDAYYKHFPFNFYGVGNSTRLNNLDKLLNTGSRLLVEIERQLPGHFYIGFTNMFQQEHFRDIGPTGIFSSDSSFKGQEKGLLWLSGLSFIYDTRNNINYSSKGQYFKVNAAYAPNLGKDFTGMLRYLLQSRSFWELSGKKHVLALNNTLSIITGNNIPFYFMSRLGGSSTMRGYYEGRYRDRNMLTAQLEYRWWPLKHWAIVGFAGTGCVFHSSLNPNDLKPNFGGGFRFFVDPTSRMSLRLDYGFGEKPVGERRNQGFIIAVNEAF